MKRIFTNRTFLRFLVLPSRGGAASFLKYCVKFANRPVLSSCVIFGPSPVAEDEGEVMGVGKSGIGFFEDLT